MLHTETSDFSIPSINTFIRFTFLLVLNGFLGDLGPITVSQDPPSMRKDRRSGYRWLPMIPWLEECHSRHEFRYAHLSIHALLIHWDTTSKTRYPTDRPPKWVQSCCSQFLIMNGSTQQWKRREARTHNFGDISFSKAILAGRQAGRPLILSFVGCLWKNFAPRFALRSDRPRIPAKIVVMKVPELQLLRNAHVSILR